MVHDIAATIEFQMSLLLFVSLGGYLLASRINQSAVIGEILVGLIMGPSLLGLVTYTDFVSSLAHLGAVILLFVVGMEFKLKEIYNPNYAPIALGGVLLPWGAGYWLAKAFGFDFGGAVFVGTALASTSIAITAQVLKEMDMLQSEAAKAVIGAAVMDDILGLLALSLSEQLTHGGIEVSAFLALVGKAAGFVVIGTLLGYKVLSSYIKRIDRSDIARRYPEFVFIFAITIAFFYSMTAELLGLSAIVGAFIAGVSLEGIKLEHSRDYKEGSEYLHIIFAALFFVSLGIIADINALHRDTIIFLLVLTVVATLTKLVGCALPAKLQGMSSRDSLIIGFGMAPRGEVAMIVALIGLNEKIIGQDLYVSLVMMSLLTTLVTPIAIRNWLAKKTE